MSCNHINVNMGKQDNYIMNIVTLLWHVPHLAEWRTKEMQKVNLSYKEMDT